jgi:hypothetical protein
MKPYEQRELGEVGEGSWVIDRAQPLTQLRLASKLASLRNPLPLERGNHATKASTNALTFFCRHCGNGATSQ